MALEGDEMVLMVMMVNGWTCAWWIEIRGMACLLHLVDHSRVESSLGRVLPKIVPAAVRLLFSHHDPSNSWPARIQSSR
jgi:hypothetical protein